MHACAVAIPTHDGLCPAHLLKPTAKGRWPAIIFYADADADADAGGIRPALFEMAQRLADAGYVVLLPDLFYRHGPYGPLVPKKVFQGDVMAILGPLMATTGNDKAAQDTEFFVAYLDKCDAVEGRKVGAVGFCMGVGWRLQPLVLFPIASLQSPAFTAELWRRMSRPVPTG